MSGSPKTTIDPSGSYISNIISKNGRNEVQIYAVNGKSGLTGDSSITRIELQAEESIIDSVWVHIEASPEETPKKRSKRKQSGEEVASTIAPTTTLAVLLVQGDILIFTPHTDKPTHRISNTTKLAGLISHQGSIWAYSSEGVVYSISTEQNRINKVSTFSDGKQTISSAQAIKFNGTGANKNTVPVLFGTSELHLVDISKTKKNKILTLPKHNDSPVKFIRQSTLNSEKIYVSKGTQIISYDLKNTEEVSSFSCSTSSTILNLQVISEGQQEVVMALTTEGIQVFNIDADSTQTDETPSSLIITTFHENSILFTNVVYTVSSELVGIWFNANEPKFTIIDWKFKSIGEIQVPVDYLVPSVRDAKEEGILSIPEEVQINNLESGELYDALVELIGAKDEQKIIQLCSTNNNEGDIKETIKSLSSEHNSNVLLNYLFAVISKEIGLCPSRKSSLSVWLKWILLIHGGAIGREPEQHENLKSLHTGLTNGMKLMPHLLALQGRLQLLKSQAQLRKNIADGVQDMDEDSEIENETQIQLDREDQEKDLIYVNGENDEDEEEEEEGEVLKFEGDEEDDEE
ncbi:uncharacterized protein CANTADRAFT_20293 [Suhomyces tanzawaensis NRRL Y-17324]|uniref:Small-subunit processome Utp12 domain-containing protein n=1 Tax=Suhomyces tanzawaensis NRRL Y-17324 TaxID=984487 RepID=A0A1E4SMH7_9ASCO|nr:uncharacterized protein CANTADRAFT_20293 [Suhomyces tanzawaensis NRRL Y-17324]ODV80721.1 hypothetical protein CANTADRAFT_20293 [Suhomyces tanzawaensis NRRL Y-17324]